MSDARDLINRAHRALGLTDPRLKVSKRDLFKGFKGEVDFQNYIS